MMGRSVLDFGRVHTLEEVFEKIDETGAARLQDIAQDIFDEKTLSVLTMMPQQ
jgi:predicted Zn-dependent peptidase